MKATNNPTAYILLKATTNSEWDNCEFAIVPITEEWKKVQAKRLETVKPFEEDYTFQSMNYSDTSVDFYSTDENGEPNMEQLLAGYQWVFVELDEGERQALTPPENRLDCYGLVVYNNGNAFYKAYGRHTSEEFWTEEFSLQQVTEELS